MGGVAGRFPGTRWFRWWLGVGGGGEVVLYSCPPMSKANQHPYRSLHGNVTVNRWTGFYSSISAESRLMWLEMEKQEKGNGGVREGHVDRKRERAGRKSDVVGDGWWQACYYYSIITSGSVEQWCTVSSLLCHFSFSVRPNPHAQTHTHSCVAWDISHSQLLL